MGGWVVGKSDFNENPVVSLDLDLDFGLRLRVCQNFKKTSSVDSEIQNDDTTLDENIQIDEIDINHGAQGPNFYIAWGHMAPCLKYWP